MAIACAERNAGLQYRLGAAQANSGEWPAAITAFEAALARDDTPAKWHFALGLANEKIERWHDASLAYRRALARDDSNAEWHWRFGTVCTRHSDWPAAVAAFRAAIARDDTNAKWHLGLATAQARLEIWDAAVQAYEAAIARHPDDATWHGRLGQARERLGDWLGAVSAYEGAIARDPNNAKWRTHVGSARAKLGDWLGAVAAYEAAIALDNTSDGRRLKRLYSKALISAGESANLNDVLKMRPEDAVARYKVAVSLHENERDTDAIRCLEPSVEHIDPLLDRFLAGGRAKGSNAVGPTAQLLFVHGGNTVLARKVSINSPELGEQHYFEHTRAGKERYQRIVDFYDSLEEAPPSTITRSVPKLHYHTFETDFGYFLYEYVESVRTNQTGQIQQRALKDRKFGHRMVDILIELAQSGIAVKKQWIDAMPRRLVALRDIQPHVDRQITVSGADRSAISSLERLAEDWEDHYRRFELFPKTIAHGNLHDGNLAIAPDGVISIFDWERFGFAPAGFDLVTLLRDNLEKENTVHLLDYYFENVCPQIPQEERNYIVCMLMVLKSAWRRKPLHKKWLNCLNDFRSS